MVLLVDLDGTLINTSHIKFKPFKDGLQDFDIRIIPVFKGAKEFIEYQLNLKNTVIIVSDSHPNYVSKIAHQIFNIQSISLTDKPNTVKVLAHINVDEKLKALFLNKENFIMIGDSWLDIELGRRLKIPTILTSFYVASEIEVRDGIGQDWKSIKMGPTFYAKNYGDLNSILSNFHGNLLAVESVFSESNSVKAVSFKNAKYEKGRVAFRCLARQEDGLCDSFAKAGMYYQIDNPNRSEELKSKLAKAVSNYLFNVTNYKGVKWDIFSYVTDKKTTSPPDKMKEIFDLVVTDISKSRILEWKDEVVGSLRHLPDYKTRREFIGKYIFIPDNIEIKDKNVVVLDDQFTSSATAQEISKQLLDRGASNILFIALFYLILPVNDMLCPICSKPLVIKIKKSDGNKFYSCLPPKFRGNGCGYTQNIVR